jgi:glycosyltransferase involved in cell wall biosynthesis
MNVLFLCSWYPTLNNPNYGIFIKEHAKAIHKVGDNLLVISVICEDSKKIHNIRNLDFIDENGIRTIQIIISSRFRDVFHHLIPYHYILIKNVLAKKSVSEFKPDIIHANVVFNAGILGYWLSKKMNLPYIITEHWSRLGKLLKKPLLSNWAINAYKNAERIMPVSGFLSKQISDLIPDIRSNKYTVIGNIINESTFTFKPKDQFRKTIHFCAIATWNKKKIPDKLPELFIDALGEFQRETGIKVQLTMIGGGDNIDFLKNICDINLIENLFTGYIEKDTIAGHIQKSDYFIHASTIETFSVVIAEALMTGTPVICSNVGALPELVNEKNGVLCNNTKTKWVAGLKLLTSKQFEQKEIRDDILNKYSFDTVGNSIHQIYKDCLNI